ncbi:glycoside hydrolase/phage tail family protein [Aquibium sp. ELW1220]|uniref:baseplate multidomain protein megatron n=1 Tax=Aquibium sp. ELW1220 TaxID=2976766 RepID=UPI0025AFE50F|nr:glycoside hydrolase/phage tail family protein [Aquibium sp. ELW1220]MDN2583261.1 glycoside hydrolase/phage tail family protein [Aquibium sp. ELW1220]
MATIILQAAGAYLGGLLGATGAAIGTAAGAIGGYLIDRALIDSTRRIEGPRLGSAQVLTAEDGAPMPRLYGTARLGATLIWATRFEEVKETSRQGSKGGPKVTSYSYHASAAFGLCEGPVAGIRRIWADGRELDLDEVTLRLHRGTEDQAPDPLIEAKQGAGNAPAYRGTAYVVFERLPLDAFGNRLPQLQFEVIRPVGGTGDKVSAMVLIPGSTEFGYAPDPVRHKRRKGEGTIVNRHVLHAATDLAASLDELQALCPNLEHVALVVAWFGDDLRAGDCRIRPAVTDRDGPAVAARWRVGDVTGDAALVVSQAGGRAAYGGSPSDDTIVAAIGELKARGLSVTLYPFVMMDVPAGNGLPDPHGGAEQAAYPWRGRITCHPAAGRTGSVDATAAARTQVEAFFGAAAPGDFSISGGHVHFSGGGADWGYRRFVLHQAKLAALAGGVDAFLIGSELRGLTTVRGADDSFPAVEALCALAADVRAMLGAGTKLSYGADWSEYFGHQPQDGSGSVFFHLDPLWAHEAIDAVGIDAYMPLSDWRDGDHDGSNPDGAAGPNDPAALRAALRAGEGYDWFYAHDEDRRARIRTPIADGAYGKPWVFRFKDLWNWWANAHVDRTGGVEAASPTAWTPRGKPIWLTELGCPAIDKGPNQPNVFSDPKSSESGLPHFSHGGRDDLAQRRFIETHLSFWGPEAPGFAPEANPLSPVYGGRMVDPQRIYLWAWDARPFPAFPLAGDVWGDGGNWLAGHWLNGRLGNPSSGDLVAAILADHGLGAGETDGAAGWASGYVISEPASPRAAIEPVADLFGLSLRMEDGRVTARRRGAASGSALALEALVQPEEGATVTAVRAPDHALAGEVIVAFRDPLNDHEAGSARRRRDGAANPGQERLGFSGCLEPPVAEALAADWLKRHWREREEMAFSLPAGERRVRPGALVRLPAAFGADDLVVTEIDEGLVRQVKAVRVDRLAPARIAPTLGDATHETAPALAAPALYLIDLPLTSGIDEPWRELRIAAWAKPWRSQVVQVSPEYTGFEQRTALPDAARLGELTGALGPGVPGRLDRGATIGVSLSGGALQSISALQQLNGGNAAAILSQSGAWEVVQFRTAEEIAPDIWRLGDLLRGQLGTEDAMLAGAAEGAPFVLLDGAVPTAGLKPAEAGLTLNWRVGPAGADLESDVFAVETATGGLRAALPLAPVHLRATFETGGDLAVTWIRRGRIGADGWDADEIPLGEEAEAYLVEIRTPGGALKRSAETTAPAWTYDAAAIAADFGGGGSAVVSVRQRKRPGGTAGLPATLTVDLP